MSADGGKATDENLHDNVGAKEDQLTLGKRVAVDSATLALPESGSTGNGGVIVPAGNTAVIVEQFEGSEDDPGKNDVVGTPQKNANRKKLRVEDGGAVDSSSVNVLAASSSEDRPSQ